MTEQTNLNLIETGIESAKEIADPQASTSSEPSDMAVEDTPVEDARVPADWREGLPDDLKNAPSLLKFKDQASLVKSYLESEKAFSSRIPIPKDDATDAEWDTFYNKIGRPEDKRYRPEDLSISEEEEPIFARYEEILHASGLTRKQGQKVLGHMIELSAQMDAEAKTREETARSQNLTALEKTFGDQMDLRVKQIEAALGQFGTDASGSQDLAVLVEQTNYHPALVQFLCSVGEKLASDRLVTGDSPALTTEKQAALDEIKKLEMDEAFQVNYRGNDFEKRQKAISRMDGLHKVVYGQTSEI